MWTQLTPSTLLTALSSGEHAALSRSATDPDQTDVLADIAASVASEWRGGLRRVCTVDARTGYVPDELLCHILADYRYRAFTRLPGMKGLLDELRVEEWRRANTVRDNLVKIHIVPPETANAESADDSGGASPSISDPEEDSVLL
jgi:hypothetical protein